MTTQDTIATHRSDREILGRDEVNDVEAILAKYLDPGVVHGVEVGGEAQFTWNYGREREQLTRLYEKAKGAQWNATDQFDWSMEVDQEQLADHMATHNPETVFLRQLSENDPSSPLRNWGDVEFRKLAFESQNYTLSQLTHGEQGALLCTAKIVEQVPWIEAKYYASTQVVDEARHVEVFSRYLLEKLSGIYDITSPLAMILDSILVDDRWDVTYLGMQIMVEGLALAAFSLVRQLTPDPLLQEILKYVMSDEARHVAFGVLSLREVYDDMSAGEIRERQEFAFEVGVRLRDRQFPAAVVRSDGRGTPKDADLVPRQRAQVHELVAVLQDRSERQEARAPRRRRRLAPNEVRRNRSHSVRGLGRHRHGARSARRSEPGAAGGELVTDDVEPGVEDEVRSRILDAADACISRYGVQKTTIDDVAKKARVARATLYKYVPGGRDELVLAVLLREAERSIDVVLTAMQSADTLEDSLTAGVLASVDRIRSDDHLAYLFSPEILGYPSRLEGVGEALVERSTRELRPYLDAGRAQGLIPPDLDDRDIADWLMRIMASLLWFEGLPRDRNDLVDFVRRFAIRPLLVSPPLEVSTSRDRSAAD